MKNVNEITIEQALELYNLIFNIIHSESFRVAEIKDILADSDYWFMNRTIINIENIREVIIKWLTENNFIVPDNFLSRYI